MNRFRLYIIVFCVSLGSCITLHQKKTTDAACKKESVKELKRLKKYLSTSSEGGIYNYNHKEVQVPDAFETIFWERKIGRDYGVTIQLEDTTSMQYLQLALSLQDIIYGDCSESITKSDLDIYFGKPTFVTKSFLANAKTSYNYSFNPPNSVSCYHGEYMGNVAYQECLTIIMEIDSKGQVVELNTSSFDLTRN